MRIRWGFAATLAAGYLAAAWAQPASHAEHAKPAAKAEPAKAAAVPMTPAGSRTYASAFEGYRPFNPEEPLKDWRRANDEVREAGGHVGILKGEPAQLTGHGAHGARQPAPGGKK